MQLSVIVMNLIKICICQGKYYIKNSVGYFEQNRKIMEKLNMGEKTAKENRNFNL